MLASPCGLLALICVCSTASICLGCNSGAEVELPTLTSRDDAITLLQSNGGDVRQDDGQVVIDLQDVNVGPSHFETFKFLEDTTELNLNRSTVTDNGLEHLAALPRLKRLHLQDTQISDAGIQHLLGLAQLEHLDLQRTQVTISGSQLVADSIAGVHIVGP